MSAENRYPGFQTPFGLADCESEVRILRNQQENYKDLYFEQTPFNEAARGDNTYLIIGRRGSGKTALAQSFSFQHDGSNPIYILVDNPRAYREVLGNVSGDSVQPRDVAVARLCRIWEYTVWRLIESELREMSLPAAQTDASSRVKRILQDLCGLLFDNETDLHEPDDRLSGLLEQEHDALSRIKQEAKRAARSRPIIVVLDTLEKYDLTDESLINAVAALIQFAEDFNQDFAPLNIHIKTLMSGEVFPHLEEEVLDNPSKSIRDQVFLFWRPRDLLRLIAWRFFLYLSMHNQLRPESQHSIDWSSYDDVLRRMWIPYFGHVVTNGRGVRENTFAYVLRHTQMRPRQLIILCNSIAASSLQNRKSTFPVMREEDIVIGIKAGEDRLATEVINSFSAAYSNIAGILNSLQGCPMSFPGKELDRRAHSSASEWPRGQYSQPAFRRLVAELGIVGRAKKITDSVIDAEFEYSIPRRLSLMPSDDCVLHPMFYSRFNVQLNTPLRIMPFRGEADFS